MIVGAAGLLLSTVPGTGLVYGLSMLSLASFGIFGSFPVFWAISMRYFKPAAVAAGLAFVNTIAQLSGMASPSLMGWIKTVTNSATLGLYAFSGVLCTGAVIVVVSEVIEPKPAPVEKVEVPLPAAQPKREKPKPRNQEAAKQSKAAIQAQAQVRQSRTRRHADDVGRICAITSELAIESDGASGAAQALSGGSQVTRRARHGLCPLFHRWRRQRPLRKPRAIVRLWRARPGGALACATGVPGA